MTAITISNPDVTGKRTIRRGDEVLGHVDYRRYVESYIRHGFRYVHVSVSGAFFPEGQPRISLNRYGSWAEARAAVIAHFKQGA